MTNLPDPPAAVYALYCQRGDVENRLKELKDSLGLGRTSCPRFLANQFRVLLAMAYVLFQALQHRAGARRAPRPGPDPAGAPDQAGGLDHPVGPAIVLHLPQPFPGWCPGASWPGSRRQDVASPSSGCARRTLEAVSLPTRRGCHRQRTVAVIPRLLAHDHAELVTPTPQMHAARPLGAVDRQQVHVHE